MSMNPWWHWIGNISVKRDVFIETGSKEGNTIAQAIAMGIPRIYSIEIDPTAYWCCQKRFQENRNVIVRLGDSRQILPIIIDPKKSTTFYLDAHYEGFGMKIESDTECPLLDELRIITSVPWKIKPTVIIDDVHLFESKWDRVLHSRFKRADWPTMEQIAQVMAGYHYQEELKDLSGAWF